MQERLDKFLADQALLTRSEARKSRDKRMRYG